MSTKQELRDEIDELIRGRNSWRREANALGRRLLAALDERNVAISELDEARATIARLSDQLAARDASDPLTTPEPRPFRVGDRVRVAAGATYRVGLSGTHASKSAGQVGVVREVWSDGDLIIDTEAESGCAASPEFCTLIEPAPDDDLPTPQPVTLTLPDGTSVTFDAVVTR